MHYERKLERLDLLVGIFAPAPQNRTILRKFYLYDVRSYVGNRSSCGKISRIVVSCDASNRERTMTFWRRGQNGWIRMELVATVRRRPTTPESGARTGTTRSTVARNRVEQDRSGGAGGGSEATWRAVAGTHVIPSRREIEPADVAEDAFLRLGRNGTVDAPGPAFREIHEHIRPAE